MVILGYFDYFYDLFQILCTCSVIHNITLFLQIKGGRNCMWMIMLKWKCVFLLLHKLLHVIYVWRAKLKLKILTILVFLFNIIYPSSGPKVIQHYIYFSLWRCWKRMKNEKKNSLTSTAQIKDTKIAVISINMFW